MAMKVNKKQILELFWSECRKVIKKPEFIRDYNKFLKRNVSLSRRIMRVMVEYNFRGFTSHLKYTKLNKILDVEFLKFRTKWGVPTILRPGIKKREALDVLENNTKLDDNLMKALRLCHTKKDCNVLLDHLSYQSKMT